WSNGAVTNQWSNNNGCEDNEYSYKLLYELHNKDHDMPKHLDESFCHLHTILLCETTKPSNSNRLSNMSDMVEQMRKLL
ncbi:hypothetical protein J1N35_013963, partial [Gossypium stocksii]